MRVNLRIVQGLKKTFLSPVIRKVLGASIPHVLILISKDYLKLITIAFLIAAPIAYYGMQQFLNGFVYHISISLWLLILPGLLVLVIAFLVILSKSMKAARVNPVEMLKYE